MSCRRPCSTRCVPKRLFPSVKLHDTAAPRMEICRERVGSGNFIPTNANAHAGEGPFSTRLGHTPLRCERRFAVQLQSIAVNGAAWGRHG
jgi:hypothetical protein